MVKIIEDSLVKQTIGGTYFAFRSGFMMTVLLGSNRFREDNTHAID
jgi:hypothetical protein